ncbi:MAG: TGS domain-containing protein, partial [Acholeplasmataceae bacterium]
MNLTFPDGSIKTFEDGMTVYEIASSISKSLAKDAIGAMINDQYIELSRPLCKDASFKIVTKKDKEALYFLRHSAAHLLAQSVLSLYPNALFGVGPAIDEGFYYDISVPGYQLTEDDLVRIEKKMHKFKDQALPIVRQEKSYEEAKTFFKHDPYKLDIIEQYKHEQLTFYTQGDFTD